MYCTAPSALMVAFDKRRYKFVVYIIELLYDKMKKASNNEVLKSVIGHLTAEIKYEADILKRKNNANSKIDLDLVVDYIAEV